MCVSVCAHQPHSIIRCVFVFLSWLLELERSVVTRQNSSCGYDELKREKQGKRKKEKEGKMNRDEDIFTAECTLPSGG